ncbi:hypothetical protein IWZ01DRAFT_161286 [Phyllosticta capitalensis]
MASNFEPAAAWRLHGAGLLTLVEMGGSASHHERLRFGIRGAQWIFVDPRLCLVTRFSSSQLLKEYISTTALHLRRKHCYTIQSMCSSQRPSERITQDSGWFGMASMKLTRERSLHARFLASLLSPRKFPISVNHSNVCGGRVPPQTGRANANSIGQRIEWQPLHFRVQRASAPCS